LNAETLTHVQIRYIWTRRRMPTFKRCI